MNLLRNLESTSFLAFLMPRFKYRLLWKNLRQADFRALSPLHEQSGASPSNIPMNSLEAKNQCRSTGIEHLRNHTAVVLVWRVLVLLAIRVSGLPERLHAQRYRHLTSPTRKRPPRKLE